MKSIFYKFFGSTAFFISFGAIASPLSAHCLDRMTSEYGSIDHIVYLFECKSDNTSTIKQTYLCYSLNSAERGWFETDIIIERFNPNMDNSLIDDLELDGQGNSYTEGEEFNEGPYIWETITRPEYQRSKKIFHRTILSKIDHSLEFNVFKIKHGHEQIINSTHYSCELVKKP